MTCTRKFSGTYQKISGTYCLPIQNAWYTGTLVQKMLVPGAAGLSVYVFTIDMAMALSTKGFRQRWVQKELYQVLQV